MQVGIKHFETVWTLGIGEESVEDKILELDLEEYGLY